MEECIVKLIAVEIVCWSALFVLLRYMFSTRSFGFCNRLVSAFHATLAVILAAISVQDWSCPVCPLASELSPSQIRALAVSEAYLIYDLVCCLLGKQFSADNVVHHIVSIVAIGAGFVYEISGSEIVACLLFTEISSPFLHMRELLKELGYKDTDLNLAADVAFAMTFSVARMIGGPYLLYQTWKADNPLIIKGTSMGIQLISTFWFYKIIKMVKYKLMKRRAYTSKVT